jgi:Flp pilus assembly protein CpaB
VRDQIVLESQLSAARRGANVAASVPPGKLAVWLPIPDLLSQTGGLRPGNRVDLLLTLGIPAAGPAAAVPSGGAPAAGQTSQPVPTTQLTLQNVELFFLGTPSGAAAASPSGQAGALVSTPAAPPGTHVAVVLLEPQDALIAKFVKDSGGTIDLALRSGDWSDRATTDPVTLDVLADRFAFRGRGAGTTGGGGR